MGGAAGRARGDALWRGTGDMLHCASVGGVWGNTIAAALEAADEAMEDQYDELMNAEADMKKRWDCPLC